MWPCKLLPSRGQVTQREWQKSKQRTVIQRLSSPGNYGSELRADKKKIISTRLETSLWGSSERLPIAISVSHVDTELGSPPFYPSWEHWHVNTKYYSHCLPPIHVLNAAQEKEELYFNILSLQDYTAAMCPGLSKGAARPSLVPLTFSHWWLTSGLPVWGETKLVQSGSSLAGTSSTFRCHI